MMEAARKRGSFEGKRGRSILIRKGITPILRCAVAKGSFEVGISRRRGTVLGRKGIHGPRKKKGHSHGVKSQKERKAHVPAQGKARRD